MLIELKRPKGQTRGRTLNHPHRHYKYTVAFTINIHNTSSFMNVCKYVCLTCTSRTARPRFLGIPDAVNYADNATTCPHLYNMFKWIPALFLKICAHLSRDQALDLLLSHVKPVLKRNENCFKMNER